jgi:glycerophosphoryl diester phosphodiesterase
MSKVHHFATWGKSQLTLSGFEISSGQVPPYLGKQQFVLTISEDVGMNPWIDRRVLLYGHQGGAKEAPSSTIFAFRQAIANGADALEMDVHATADRVLVVTHDETVDRTTPSSGRIAELTWNELSRLDNAHWWSHGHDAVTGLADHDYPLRGKAPADPAFGIARLSDVLDEFPTTILNFDIKGTTPERTPGVVPYEDLLADILRAYQRCDDVIVASFFDDAIQRFRGFAPGVPTSTALAECYQIASQIRAGEKPTVHGSVVALQIPYRFAHDPLFDASFVEHAHAVDLAIHVWTIDEASEMREVLHLGVDGLITDYPSRASDVFAELGVSRHVP